MLLDDGELLFQADKMDFIAIRLEPSRLPMRVPTLLTRGSVGKRNGGGEKIFDGIFHARGNST
jgi:hypothetical protein